MTHGIVNLTANPLAFVPSVTAVTPGNATARKIVRRIVQIVNVIWNATETRVSRNVKNVLRNVVCNVTAEKSVISFAKKTAVI